MQRLKEQFGFSQRHACELIQIPRSTYRYASRKDDGDLREKLVTLAHAQPRYGYRRLGGRLRGGGGGGGAEGGGPGLPGAGASGGGGPPGPGTRRGGPRPGAPRGR